MSARELFRVIAGSVYIGLTIVGNAKAGVADSGHGRVPSSVAAEHKELHEELARVIKAGGRTATEARNVEKLLQPHFIKEEQFALPPRGAAQAGIRKDAANRSRDHEDVRPSPERHADHAG
jgi:hypothetical protein